MQQPATRGIKTLLKVYLEAHLISTRMDKKKKKQAKDLNHYLCIIVIHCFNDKTTILKARSYFNTFILDSVR